MGMAMKRLEKFDHIVRPKNILEEVRQIVLLMFPDFDFSQVRTVHQDIVNLFNGKFPGYRKCNTFYHDLRHTEDCLLEMARLIHGVSLNGCTFSKRSVNLGLIAAILHDTGYIQTVKDTTGTGAKYTLTHVERSIDFTRKYFKLKKYPRHDYNFCENCLKCTGLDVDIKDIQFESPENKFMGNILGTADLIGQMADSTYLQKLPCLFQEFQEGGITDYKTEFDLLAKSQEFWEFTQKRFLTELGNVDRYLRDHFWVRWGIDRDLDREAIENNLTRLNYILKNHPTDYRRYLRPSPGCDPSSLALCIENEDLARGKHQAW